MLLERKETASELPPLPLHEPTSGHLPFSEAKVLGQSSSRLTQLLLSISVLWALVTTGLVVARGADEESDSLHILMASYSAAALFRLIVWAMARPGQAKSGGAELMPTIATHEWNISPSAEQAEEGDVMSNIWVGGVQQPPELRAKIVQCAARQGEAKLIDVPRQYLMSLSRMVPFPKLLSVVDGMNFATAFFLLVDLLQARAYTGSTITQTGIMTAQLGLQFQVLMASGYMAKHWRLFQLFVGNIAPIEATLAAFIAALTGESSSKMAAWYTAMVSYSLAGELLDWSAHRYYPGRKTVRRLSQVRPEFSEQYVDEVTTDFRTILRQQDTSDWLKMLAGWAMLSASLIIFKQTEAPPVSWRTLVALQLLAYGSFLLLRPLGDILSARVKLRDRGLFETLVDNVVPILMNPQALIPFIPMVVASGILSRATEKVEIRHHHKGMAGIKFYTDQLQLIADTYPWSDEFMRVLEVPEEQDWLNYRRQTAKYSNAILAWTVVTSIGSSFLAGNYGMRILGGALGCNYLGFWWLQHKLSRGAKLEALLNGAKRYLFANTMIGILALLATARIAFFMNIKHNADLDGPALAASGLYLNITVTLASLMYYRKFVRRYAAWYPSAEDIKRYKAFVSRLARIRVGSIPQKSYMHGFSPMFVRFYCEQVERPDIHVASTIADGADNRGSAGRLIIEPERPLAMHNSDLPLPGMVSRWSTSRPAAARMYPPDSETGEAKEKLPKEVVLAKENTYAALRYKFGDLQVGPDDQIIDPEPDAQPKRTALHFVGGGASEEQTVVYETLFIHHSRNAAHHLTGNAFIRRAMNSAVRMSVIGMIFFTYELPSWLNWASLDMGESSLASLSLRR